ncbi:hypothetical protein [Cupriavidus nantongensis]|uniref:hypothetical protein n=1 Tax=Cupriavidus nantongensis TaxID=1796606 RepID=UPI00358F43AB
MESQAITSYMEIGRQIDNCASMLIDCLLERGIFKSDAEGRSSTVSAEAIDGEQYSLTVDAHHVRLVGNTRHVFYKDQFGSQHLIGAIEFRVQGISGELEKDPLLRVYVDDQGGCGWRKVGEVHRTIPTNQSFAAAMRAAIFQELAGRVLERLKQQPLSDQAIGFMDLG